MGVKLVCGCNYHTKWQAHRGMRFVLESYENGQATLSTRTTHKKFTTKIEDLIFIETPHNIRKAKAILEKEILIQNNMSGKDQNEEDDNLNVTNIMASEEAAIIRSVGLADDSAIDVLETISKLREQSKIWEELSNVDVKDHTDVLAMKNAEKNRKIIKSERNDAEKFIKSVRAGVQEQYSVLSLKDKAYLKLFQHFEAKAKAFEDDLLQKEQTKINWERQEFERITEERQNALSLVCDDYMDYPVGSMSEESFNNMLASFKVAKEKKDAEEKERIEREEKEQKEREEQEAKQKALDDLLQKRNNYLSVYARYEYEGKGTLTADSSEKDFKKVLAAAKEAEENWKKAEAERVELLRLEGIKTKLFNMGFSFNGTHFNYSTINIAWENIKKAEAELVEPALVRYQAKIKKIKDQEAAEAAKLKAAADLPQHSISKEASSEEALTLWLNTVELPVFEARNEKEKFAKETIMANFKLFKKASEEVIEKICK